MNINNWFPAPSKIQFGKDMFITNIAVGKDYCVTIYTEKHVVDNFIVKISIENKHNEPLRTNRKTKTA